MQKKLLSIVMIIGFGAIHCGEEYAPVISEAQHTENDRKYKELAHNINALNAQLSELKAQKDALESHLSSHDEREQFEEKLFDELTGKERAIVMCKINSNHRIYGMVDQRKKSNNGIERAWFS